jgi:hypothetical protein
MDSGKISYPGTHRILHGTFTLLRQHQGWAGKQATSRDKLFFHSPEAPQKETPLHPLQAQTGKSFIRGNVSKIEVGTATNIATRATMAVEPHHLYFK